MIVSMSLERGTHEFAFGREASATALAIAGGAGRSMGHSLAVTRSTASRIRAR